MEPMIATVNINIGMGKDNPVLKIRASDDVSALVDQLIANYQLPKKVHSIIMARVTQQLPQTPLHTPKHAHPSTTTPSTYSKKSVSPIRGINSASIRPPTRRVVVVQKQNNPNLANWQSETTKNVLKTDKSVSPLKGNTNRTMHRKIEIKTTKSPAKYAAFSKKNEEKKEKVEASVKIVKLFKRLTKMNPSNVKIMSPEFINLKGLDKNLLSCLQDFFQNLQEQEFDLMDQSYFILKTAQMGFQEALTQKDFDYCYLD